MSRCPPPEHLAEYLASRLPPAALDAVDAHLPGCPRCQDALAVLTDGDHVPNWRRWLAADPRSTAVPVPPAVDEATLPGGPPPGYEILGRLGSGGVGVVYQARQVALGRVVALKLLRVGPLAGAEERARFVREARAAAALRHPHIVQVHEVGDHGGTPYLVLEYADGGSLADRLGRSPQPADAAAEVVAVLARAAQHAHDHGIVHRDLKPANVLLCSPVSPRPDEVRVPEGRGYIPKITDFGLARLIDGGPTLTGTGDVLGTPCYMAPEQAQGSKDVGPPADIYALGAILYECLTGRPPFHAATTFDTLLQVVHHDPVPPRHLQPGVPRDLETICLKCLQKDPARRYPSAASLADDLDRYLARRPIAARPVGPLERGGKWVRRSPAAAGLVGVCVLVAVVGVPLLLAAWLDAARKRGEADQLRLDAEGREARLTAVRGLDLCDQGEVARGLEVLRDAVALADQGGMEALAAAARANMAAWARQLRRPGETHAYPAGAAWSLAFSPDGDTLAVGGPFGVHLWDPDGRHQRAALLVRNPPWQAITPAGGSVRFSPDGALLTAGYDDGGVRVWDARTRTLLRTLSTGTLPVTAAGFHPGGEALAVATHDSVQVWNPRTGRLLAREPYPDRVTCLAFSPDGKTLAVGDYLGQGWLWPVAAGGRPRSGREGRRLLRHGLTVTAIAFDPRPTRRTLATGSRDGAVRFWDAETGEPRGRPLFHADEVGAVAWSPDGRWLLTGGRDQTAQVWDADTLAASDAPFRLSGPVTVVRFAPSSRGCVLATSDGHVHFWHLAAAPPPTRTYLHGPPVEQVGFWPTDRTVLTVGWLGARVWADGGACVGVFNTDDRVRHAAWAGRAPVLVSAHWYQDVERWRWRDAKEPEERLLPPLATDKQTPVIQVAVSPDGAVAYGACAPGTEVRRWDVPRGEEIRGRFRFDGRVSRLALSSDGALLAAIVQGEGRPAVWLRPTADPADAGGDLAHDDAPRCLTFSGDCRTLAVGYRSGRVRLWAVEGRREIPWRAGEDAHRGEVLAAAFSPDGRTLLTGGTDGRARFWDVATGLPLGPALKHPAPVLAVGFRADGSAVATGCQDGRAAVWPPP